MDAQGLITLTRIFSCRHDILEEARLIQRHATNKIPTAVAMAAGDHGGQENNISSSLPSYEQPENQIENKTCNLFDTVQMCIFCFILRPATSYLQEKSMAVKKYFPHPPQTEWYNITSDYRYRTLRRFIFHRQRQKHNSKSSCVQGSARLLSIIDNSLRAEAYWTTAKCRNTTASPIDAPQSIDQAILKNIFEEFQAPDCGFTACDDGFPSNV